MYQINTNSQFVELYFTEDVDLEMGDMVNALNTSMNRALDQAGPEANVLLDLTHLQLTFPVLVQGLGETRDEESMWSHPNIGRLAVVTANAILKMGANALGQVQYGNRHVAVFATRDEATAYLEQGARV